MKKIIFKTVIALSISIGFFSSCINDDTYEVPEQTLATYELTPTTTVEAVDVAANTALTTSSPVVLYTTDDIIEAYVTSSDEKGTFYKSISFQTIPTDGSAPTGFSVPINATTLYGKGFTPGRKVYIKLNGLYSAIVYGSLQIGSLFEGTIGRISEFEWQDHLFPSATIVDEDSFVRTLTLADAYTDNNQNTLIELSTVQFSESSLNRTYYDIDSGGGATNHTLIGSTGGSEQVIRFSSFAPFTGNQVPSQSGKIRGVLSKYDTDFQFIVRYESDIKLTMDRFDVSPPVVGGALVYSGTLTEPFTSYLNNASSFPKYINDAAVGSRYWQVKTFSGNKYIQMTSFGGTPEVNRALFIVPVDFTAANNFSFKTKSGFDNGSPLKVYYSTNYVPGSNINTATLIDITSSFSIPNGPATGYPTPFSNSGVYAIPAVITGNGYFILEYTGNGNGGITTTMQVEDLLIN
ncbi:DUF5689 domain-containing protein [Flavobacterium sp.]|uniref:DUF5689 domain-containing protein n=1 Tax=Flavobacterium sp. TaxID=239 RepID=UPI003750C09D